MYSKVNALRIDKIPVHPPEHKDDKTITPAAKILPQKEPWQDMKNRKSWKRLNAKERNRVKLISIIMNGGSERKNPESEKPLDIKEQQRVELIRVRDIMNDNGRPEETTLTHLVPGVAESSSHESRLQDGQSRGMVRTWRLGSEKPQPIQQKPKKQFVFSDKAKEFDGLLLKLNSEISIKAALDPQPRVEAENPIELPEAMQRSTQARPWKGPTKRPKNGAAGKAAVPAVEPRQSTRRGGIDVSLAKS